MIFENNIVGHNVPNHQHGEEGHRPNHPNKPQPPIIPGGPERPDKPTPPVGPEKPEEEVTIIVNGEDKVIPKGKENLTYEEVVKLAYGNYVNSDTVIYTVVYSNGPKENKKGTMVKGSSVVVRKGMIFNVGRSDKS